jgi:hypothetical protein
VGVAGYQDGPSGGAYSGIDHDQVNRFRGEIFVGLADSKRTIEYVMRQDTVRDVNYVDVRIDIENHAFEDSD